MITVYHVDVPTGSEDEDESWSHVRDFESREAAIAWIRKFIDPTSEDGKVCLISC